MVIEMNLGVECQGNDDIDLELVNEHYVGAVDYGGDDNDHHGHYGRDKDTETNLDSLNSLGAFLTMMQRRMPHSRIISSTARKEVMAYYRYRRSVTYQSQPGKKTYNSKSNFEK